MASDSLTFLSLFFYFFHALDQTHCCMPASQSGSLALYFDVEPGVNVTIGDKVVLNCSIDTTSDFEDLQIFSRSAGANFNGTCAQSHSGKQLCLVQINAVQLRHQGTYDCIATHKGPLFECYQSSLELKVMEKPIAQSTTESTTDSRLITYELLKSTESVDKTEVTETTTARGNGSSLTYKALYIMGVLVYILEFYKIT